MNLYNVDIEGLIVMAAESEDDALDKVEDALRTYGGRFAEDLSATRAIQIKTTNDLMDQWTDDCLPYGTKGDAPISQYIP